jgi:hypothetical protein
MQKLFTGALLAFLTLSATSEMRAQNKLEDSLIVENVKAHTVFLSSDKLKGRGTGSSGIALARDYISQQFEEMDLQPLSDGTHRQNFNVPDQTQPESNVIGVLPAKTQTEKSLVFTAHYDGYGVHMSEDSTDSIYNGARDNAVGVAALIELARMYVHGSAPLVNLIFVATAAEEIGLHGSEYYLENPVYEAEDILMCLNIDGFNVSGKRINFFIMPRQGVDFVDDIALLAQRSGWIYDPPDWIDSMNTNFDTASFLKRGIPAVTLWVGDRLMGGGMAPSLNFGDIHSASDEINDDWSWSGVVDHLELYKRTGDYFMHVSRKASVNNPDLFQ